MRKHERAGFGGVSLLIDCTDGPGVVVLVSLWGDVAQTEPSSRLPSLALIEGVRACLWAETSIAVAVAVTPYGKAEARQAAFIADRRKRLGVTRG